MKAIRLLQGYLWAPKDSPFRPELPARLGPAYLLLDPITPPFAFFDDGTPTASQQFYQLTLLVKTEEEPAALRPLVFELSQVLGTLLEATPTEVGWLLLEDLRPL